MVAIGNRSWPFARSTVPQTMQGRLQFTPQHQQNLHNSERMLRTGVGSQSTSKYHNTLVKPEFLPHSDLLNKIRSSD